MIKKVMTATINYDHPQKGMIHAFDSLFYTSHFDYFELGRQGASPHMITKQFIEEVVNFQPDWLWLQCQNSGIIQSDGLAEIQRRSPRTVLTHWMGDCRDTVSDYLSSICRTTHVSFIAAAGQTELFKAAGAPEVHYVQMGLDWHEDVLEERNWTPPFRVPEVLMIGNHYGSTFPGTTQREGAMRALGDAGFDYGVVGKGWPSDIRTAGECHVKDQVSVWKRAKVGVSISNFNDIPLYYSDRQLISMASGTPIVCYHIPLLEDEFKDGDHCLFFRTNPQLVSRVRWLLDNPDKAKAMGMAGRGEVLKNHTWFKRIFDMLPIVERVQASL